MPTHAFHVRPAVPADVPTLVRFIRELAEYERLLPTVTATENLLHRALFDPRPAAEAVIGEVNETPAGFALFFQNFSTFVGKPGLYLEDLYVTPAWRGRGLGGRLLAHLAAIAVERGYGRMEWSVLDWNEPAIEVYRSIGAPPMTDWRICRLTGDALKNLAARG